MDFSAALELMKKGRRMARKGWIQPGKYVYLEPESTCVAPDGETRTLVAHLRFKNAEGKVQVGVQPSHAGLLADDWYDVGEAQERASGGAGTAQGADTAQGVDGVGGTGNVHSSASSANDPYTGRPAGR
ncbi:Thoeris anti-defense Tad2 family protein [Streptomyces sp. URMC 123]|uniref:Thoeris anti-defense Tad2 family protein n=1 Tax=Streptomyces sp. URMC 123 TaxID=3423403 RepID=UPI003F1E3220